MYADITSESPKRRSEKKGVQSTEPGTESSQRLYGYGTPSLGHRGEVFEGELTAWHKRKVTTTTRPGLLVSSKGNLTSLLDG